MEAITLSSEELRILLSCRCADAVQLYLYRKSGEPLELAMAALEFSADRMRTASEQLRMMGCWDVNEKAKLSPPEKPQYSETDLEKAMVSKNSNFSKFVGEAQRRLGRTLSTEELKILLGFLDYLRMPTEVVALLLSFCVERNRRKGMRAPSMRSVEKEAYHWADENIDTMEAALRYMQIQNQIQSRISRLRVMMQIDDRRLTAGEEQYLTKWIQMGFPDDAIKLAYEKTCLNTGGLKWAYMNSIMTSWHEKNLHTVQDISTGDTAPKRKGTDNRSMYQTHAQTTLTPLERQAVASALEEEEG
ncbi:MAG: DnaD domain protein [Oscillospiraceae bacterium]|nr:DnaD domain protein [Oscillospiraceae bacterium]